MPFKISALLLSLLVSFSLMAEPAIVKPECKLSCGEIISGISQDTYNDARNKVISIILRDNIQIPENNYGQPSSYLFWGESLAYAQEQHACSIKKLSHCIMVEKFNELYEQQATLISQQLVKKWISQSNEGEDALLLYLDSIKEAINILQPTSEYKPPNNIFSLYDSNLITSFFARRMPIKLDPVLIKNYLSKMDDFKQRVKKVYSLSQLSTNK